MAIAELCAFEVNHTPSDNLTVDVRARDQDGDVVVAMARAVVQTPVGTIKVGMLENWYS